MYPEIDIIMLALARWDGHYSSTAFSLAKELSRYNRVFYIDNPFTLITYTRELAQDNGLHVITGSAAVKQDQATADAICELLGYQNAVMTCESPAFGGRCWYSSCYDNNLGSWNGNDFITENACHAGNRWIGTLTCSNKITNC